MLGSDNNMLKMYKTSLLDSRNLVKIYYESLVNTVEEKLHYPYLKTSSPIMSNSLEKFSVIAETIAAVVTYPIVKFQKGQLYPARPR